jgi:hypothetical protein
MPGPDNCIRVISGVGTPALWWVAIFALVAAAILWMEVATGASAFRSSAY